MKSLLFLFTFLVKTSSVFSEIASTQNDFGCNIWKEFFNTNGYSIIKEDCCDQHEIECNNSFVTSIDFTLNSGKIDFTNFPQSPYLEKFAVKGDVYQGSVPVPLLQSKYIKILDLSNSNISSVPESLEQNNALEELYLNNNKFTKYPTQLNKLANLKILYLNDNLIEEDINPLYFESNLNLQQINLSSNNLLNLDFSNFVNVDKLNFLDISNNPKLEVLIFNLQNPIEYCNFENVNITCYQPDTCKNINNTDYAPCENPLPNNYKFFDSSQSTQEKDNIDIDETEGIFYVIIFAGIIIYVIYKQKKKALEDNNNSGNNNLYNNPNSLYNNPNSLYNNPNSLYNNRNNNWNNNRNNNWTTGRNNRNNNRPYTTGSSNARNMRLTNEPYVYYNHEEQEEEDDYTLPKYSSVVLSSSNLNNTCTVDITDANETHENSNINPNGNENDNERFHLPTYEESMNITITSNSNRP